MIVPPVTSVAGRGARTSAFVYVAARFAGDFFAAVWRVLLVAINKVTGDG